MLAPFMLKLMFIQMQSDKVSDGIFRAVSGQKGSYSLTKKVWHCRDTFRMLSDTYNNNMSMPVAKRSTFVGCELMVDSCPEWLYCSLFGRCMAAALFLNTVRVSQLGCSIKTADSVFLYTMACLIPPHDACHRHHLILILFVCYVNLYFFIIACIQCS